MSDPKRLLEEDGALADLLREPLELEPPPNAKARVWAGVVATVGPPGGGGGPPGGEGAAGSGPAATTGGSVATTGSSVAAGSAFSVVTAAKWALIGGAGAAAVLGATTAFEPSSARLPGPPPTFPSAPTLAAPITVPASAPWNAAMVAAPSAAGPALGVSAVVPRVSSTSAAASARVGEVAAGDLSLAPTEQAPPSPPATASASSAASRLLEENRLLGLARSALQNGNASSALATIEASRVQFPRGVLAQERDALEVEALSASGRHGDARAKASLFLERYPTSPHAPRMGELAR